MGNECGLPRVLSVILTAALRGPVTPGVKITEIAQLALAARLEPQVVVSAKSVSFGPAMDMSPITTGSVPLLVRVSVWEALEAPTRWVLNLRFGDDRVRVSGSSRMETV